MKRKTIILISVIVVVLIIWGLVGAQQAAKLTYDCKLGLGDGNSICWIWEKNKLGEIADIFTR